MPQIHRFVGPGCVYIQSYCYHNTLIQKKPKMLYRKSVKANADEVLSLNNLSDSIFETFTVAMQIDPEGSPVFFYGKQKSMRLHCLQWKYSQLFYPQSSSRNERTVGFLSRNRAGWSQADIEQEYVYIYLCNTCANTEKDFSTSYGFIEILLKKLPP